MKNEEEKNEDFSTCPKYFYLYFSEALDFADFKYVFGFFHIFLRSKVTALQSGSILPTLQSCSVWSKKDIKNLNTYLKSAKFKVSEKYKLKRFKQVEKIFIFFFFIFIFIFEFVENFYKLIFFRSQLSFNEVLLSIISFFPSRGIDQNVRTARTFGINYSLDLNSLISDDNSGLLINFQETKFSNFYTFSNSSKYK